MQGSEADVPVGKVFVSDPDKDAEGVRKYLWNRPLDNFYPGFFLNSSTGEVSMLAETAPGR